MSARTFKPAIAPAPAQPRFRLTAFADLKPGSTPAYLIKPLIPRVGLTVVWGPPKCGKSFWMFDAALHVALGWEYRGRRVQQGPVVYCAFEGAEGFKARAEVFRQRFKLGEQQVPFYLSAAPMNMVKDHEALAASIAAYVPDGSPVAVVLDTLNRSLAGSESSDEDMTAYIRAADAIRDAFDCAIIVVHHCGIDGTRPRGHTSLAGAVDAQLAVTRDATNNIVVTVEHMKDGPEGETLASRLEVVQLGEDDDGDAVTSCIVIPAEVSAKPASTRKLSDKHRLALVALAEAILSHGAPAPLSFELPGDVRTVNVDHWREELYRRSILDRTDPNPRQDFKRIRQTLAARHLIGERDSLVWQGVAP